MANSDKNILITPSVGLSTNPTIRFNGANNTPTTLRVLDDGTVSFEGTAGQLFSISDGLTGSIFSVNDISGIPSIEALDTGLVKINQYNGNAAFGSSAAIQNSSLVNAKVSISTTSASTPGLIIKAFASQTANIQEWQNSSGTVLASIGPNGTVYMGSNGSANIATFYNGTSGYGAGNISSAGTFNINGANIGFPYTSSGAVVSVNATSAISIPLTVRGYASQTANLQEWKDSSGNVLASITSSGRLRATAEVIGTGTYIALGSNGGNAEVVYLGYNYDQSGAGGIVLNRPVRAPDAAKKVLVVRGVASQTANLQEWQDSTGTTISSINAAGNTLTISGVAANYINPSAGANTPYIEMGVSVSNTISFVQRTASAVNIIVKGATSQSANLQEWQDSAGTIIARISSSGGFFTKGQLYASSATSTSAIITSLAADITPLKVDGYYGQTANLQEWRDTVGGTVLAKVDNVGNFTAKNLTDSGWVTPTLSNSFISGGVTPQYRLLNGVVYFRGNVNSGTAAATAFTLPSGYRPAVTTVISVQKFGTAEFSHITINTDGTFQPNHSSAWLSGVSFPIG